VAAVNVTPTDPARYVMKEDGSSGVCERLKVSNVLLAILDIGASVKLIHLQMREPLFHSMPHARKLVAELRKNTCAHDGVFFKQSRQFCCERSNLGRLVANQGCRQRSIPIQLDVSDPSAAVGIEEVFGIVMTFLFKL
jgi:hypothetical protein